MLGHKRGHCSPAKTPTVTIKNEDTAQETDDISLALRDLNLQGHVSDDPNATIGKSGTSRKRLSNRFQPVKAQSIFSLTSEDKAGFDSLVRPGIMNDSIEEDEEKIAAEKLQRFFDSQKNIRPKTTTGTVSHRTPRSSRAHEIKTEQQFSELEFWKSDNTKVKKEVLDEEAELLQFVEERSKKPAANVYTIPASVVGELEAKAKKLNIAVQRIQRASNNNVTKEGTEVCVVIGKKGEHVDEVIGEAKNENENGSMLGMALKSGAVGAVVTWLYLAFT